MSIKVADALVVGHYVKDIHPGGDRIGGTAVYATLTLRRLGLRPALVTSLAEKTDLSDTLPGVSVHRVLSKTTTTFVNAYDGPRRTQRILETAEALSAEHVPDVWRTIPWILLGPVADEIDNSLAGCFPKSTVVASIQGWLRNRGHEGIVSRRYWSGDGVLPYISAALVSEEDVCHEGQIEEWAERVPVLVVTMGSSGARVHMDGHWSYIPVFPAEEVDPTGAGDVFAAAFMARLREAFDPIQAATFAACAASLSVENMGILGIPTRAQVDRRLLDPG